MYLSNKQEILVGIVVDLVFLFFSCAAGGLYRILDNESENIP